MPGHKGFRVLRLSGLGCVEFLGYRRVPPRVLKADMFLKEKSGFRSLVSGALLFCWCVGTTAFVPELTLRVLELV